MGFMDGAKARLAAAGEAIKMPSLPSWWKRKDATAERAAVAAQINPLLIWGCFVAAFAAAVVEVGFMFLRVVRMVGDVHWRFDWTSGNSEGIVPGFDWAVHLTLHPLLAGLLFAASAVVVWFSLFWIPGQLALRGQGPLRRGSLVAVGLLCNVYILSNVVVGQHDNRTEDMRDAAVAQEQVSQSRDSLQTQINRIDAQLTAMRDQAQVGVYAAIAASVGEEVYRRDYMSAEALAQDPSEARRQIIRRAVGAAARADGLEARRDALQAQLDAAPTASSVAVSLATDRATRDVETFKSYVDAWQGVVLGLALSFIGIFGSYWGFGLLQARALLDPTAPAKEHAAERAEAAEDRAAERIDTVGDEPRPAPENGTAPLELPPLPDLRGLEDIEFDALSATVDEEGRVLKRFSGWRAPKPSKTDARRAPDPAGDTMAMADDPAAAAAAADAGDDIDDLAAWVRGQAQQPAAEERLQ